METRDNPVHTAPPGGRHRAHAQRPASYQAPLRAPEQGRQGNHSCSAPQVLSISLPVSRAGFIPTFGRREPSLLSPQPGPLHTLFPLPGDS